MEEQLTLEQLCGYIPFGVHLINQYGNWHNTTLHKSISIYEMLKMKPIFHNLKTDLTREIEHNGERFVPLDRIQLLYEKEIFIWVSCDKMEIEKNLEGFAHSVDLLDGYEIIKLLQEWQFWIYDQSYFEKGIILDINEVNKFTKCITCEYIVCENHQKCIKSLL